MSEPGDTLWAWQERTEEGWGIVAAYVALVGLHGPLVTRNREMAERVFGPLARQHVGVTGNPLRLARFQIESEEVRQGP